MVSRIEVGLNPGITDAIGLSTRNRIDSDLGIPLDSVRLIRAFVFDFALSSEELDFLGKEVFADPIIENYRVNKALAQDFDWVLEIGFKPGVTDNVGRTSTAAVIDALGRSVEGEVYTSEQFLLKGKLDENAMIANGPSMLGNFVSVTSGAVTFMGFNSYREKYGDIVEIDGVAPSRENILNGSYGLTATYYLTLDGRSSESVNEFVEFAKSDDGKKSIDQNFISVSQ